MSHFIKGPDGTRALVGGTGKADAIAADKTKAEEIRRAAKAAAPRKKESSDQPGASGPAADVEA